ncbi:MAG: ABC transporter substrate-binding protein [Propionibacteriaceae bacterium]
MNRRTMMVAAVASAASVMFAACGSSEPAKTADFTAAAKPISVKDSRGKTVTLDLPATRVVTLEWGNTEDVIALGLQPVGVADPKGFATWDTSVKISGDPVDVGMRTEPSLESVAKASPDLIIGVENSVPAAALEQMEKIAPVVLFKGADANRPLDQMRENFSATASLIGKEKQAFDTLEAFDKTLETARTTLANKQTGPVALTYVNATGNAIDFRMHSDRSLPGAVAKEIGLANAWKEKGDDAWGIGSLDVEGMTTLPADTHMLYFTATATADPVTTTLAENPAWKALPMVTGGHVKRMPDGIWLYGGPAALTQWVEALTASFA